MEQRPRALGGAGIAQVDLDDVPLRPSHVLAEPAYDEVAANLRLWLSVVALNGAGLALELTAAYVKDRKIFGRPLAEFDNTRAVVGRVSADIAQAQHSVEWGLLRRRSGVLSAIEAAPLVLSAAQTFRDAADAGLQLHGGYGYMQEYPISGVFADAQLLLLLSGVTDPISDLADAKLGNATPMSFT